MFKSIWTYVIIGVPLAGSLYFCLAQPRLQWVMT